MLEQYSDPLDDRTTVAPDIATPLSFESYTNGVDPALERALALTSAEAEQLSLDSSGAPTQGWHRWQRASQAGARPRVVDRVLEPLQSGAVVKAVERYHRMRADGMAVPDEDGLNRLGYDLLWRGEQEPSLAIMQLAARAYPQSANAYDSYAEALEAAGELGASAAEAARALIWMRPDEVSTFGPTERSRIERFSASLGSADHVASRATALGSA